MVRGWAGAVRGVGAGRTSVSGVVLSGLGVAVGCVVSAGVAVGTGPGVGTGVAPGLGAYLRRASRGALALGYFFAMPSTHLRAAYILPTACPVERTAS